MNDNMTETNVVAAVEEKQSEYRPEYKNEQRGERKPRGPRRDRNSDRNAKKDETVTRTVAVNRVTKVVKGGRNMRFAALIVAGDGKGKVGIGLGKAREVPEAIEKATKAAKRDMITVATDKTTIPHTIFGIYGRSKVLLMPAMEGTGVIAGGPVRAVIEVSGIKDIRTKSIGSNNPINCAKATLEGLRQLRTLETVNKLRGKKEEE